MARYENVNGIIKQVAGGGVTGTDGILVEDDVVKLNANFNVKSTPLGTNSSKLAIYSDGKIGVDFTESPVVLAGELLFQGDCPAKTNQITDITIPNFSNYDMFYVAYRVRSSTTPNVWNTLADGYFQKPVNTGSIKLMALSNRREVSGVPQGMQYCFCLLNSLNPTTGTISRISFWYADSFLSDRQNWTADCTATPTELDRVVHVEIYGMKAK